MPDQRLGIDARQFFLADRESDYRNVRGPHALIAEFLVERHVGVAVHRRDHRRLLSRRAEFLDRRDFSLPVGKPERRVVLHDVFILDTFGFQVGPDDLVAGAGIDVIGALEHEALHLASFLAHQIFDRRHRLVVRNGTAIEDIIGSLLTLVFERVEQQAVQFLEHRQYRLAGHRRPASKHGGDFVLDQQLAGLLREQRPVRRRIDHDRLDLLSQEAALCIDVGDLHQHQVFQDGFADRHRTGQRVEYSDLDGVFGLRLVHTSSENGENSGRGGEPAVSNGAHGCSCVVR